MTSKVSVRHVLWPLLGLCWIFCSEAQDLLNIQEDQVQPVLNFLKKYGEEQKKEYERVVITYFSSSL